MGNFKQHLSWGFFVFLIILVVGVYFFFNLILESELLTSSRGIAVLTIGLLIMGIGIPEKTPTVLMILGLIVSIFWR